MDDAWLALRELIGGRRWVGVDGPGPKPALGIGNLHNFRTRFEERRLIARLQGPDSLFDNITAQAILLASNRY